MEQFEKTIQVGQQSRVRVSVSSPLYDSDRPRVVLSFTSYDSSVAVFSTSFVFETEQQVSAVADAINAALGHAYPREF